MTVLGIRNLNMYARLGNCEFVVIIYNYDLRKQDFKHLNFRSLKI